MKNYNALKNVLLIANSFHGSGIDCDWELTENKTSYVLCNSYHCMNDNGYYDGYLDFVVIMNKKTAEYTIRFVQPPQHTYRKYGQLLKEYLYDTFSYMTYKEMLMDYKGKPYYLKIY